MKATALHRQVVRSDVAVTSVARRPRAIVVVLGEELDHYTELYHTLECSTIAVETTNAPQHEVNDVAITVSRETARLIRVAQLSEMGMAGVPVMFHIMGNSGRGLIEALEREVLFVLNDHIPSLPPHTAPKALKSMNASTRSLFTNDTDPMSSDDEDDESSHEESSIIETLPLAPTCSFLRESHHTLHARCQPRTPPSVHRIDMERTGISLQHSLNPEDRAYRRDLEMFCSHLSMMLWDMPRPPTTRGFSACIRDAVGRILMFLVLLWNCFLRMLFGGFKSPIRQQELAGLSLSQQHALMYVNDKDETVRCLLQEANVVMNTKLQGTRKQHGAKYVAFVQQTLDRISPLPNDDDDGFSSDEED